MNINLEKKVFFRKEFSELAVVEQDEAFFIR